MMPDKIEKPLLTSFLFPGKLDGKMDGSVYDSALKEWDIKSTNGTGKRLTVKTNRWPAVRLKKFKVDR